MTLLFAMTRVPLLLVAGLLFITTATAQISGERPVAAPAYETANLGRALTLASDGNGFLAAWSDGRAAYILPFGADGKALAPATAVLDRYPAGDTGISGIAVVWDRDAQGRDHLR